MRDYRDIIGGAVLVLIGAFAAFHALTSLRLGTISQVGPALFPAALGGLLVMLGLLILVPAFFRTGEMPEGDFRSFITILASILAFAIVVRPFGLVPAIIVLTLIASRADRKLGVVGVLALAICLSLAATLIFRVGLGVQLATLTWPW